MEKPSKHSHKFIEEYEGFGAFGLSRAMDEETIVFYLQKFSDDELILPLGKKMTDSELEEKYELINRMMKNHLSEAEYHRLFLKDGTH